MPRVRMSQGIVGEYKNANEEANAIQPDLFGTIRWGRNALKQKRKEKERAVRAYDHLL